MKGYNPLIKNGAIYRDYQVTQGLYQILHREFDGIFFFREEGEKRFIRVIPPYYYVTDDLMQKFSGEKIILVQDRN